jgi:4-amino-4-deoxy-L-arabinose transferase-like glycosyltransferase
MNRRHRWLLAFILMIGFALRILYIHSQRTDVLFDYPQFDEGNYVAKARALATGTSIGSPTESHAWFQPPGIVYALTTVFRLAGPSLLLPRLVQALAQTISCFLVFLIARRFFSINMALAAAALLAVHGVVIFECYELLPPTWILLFDLLTLYLLLLAKERSSVGISLGAGLALGASAVFSPLIIPFALVGAVWLRRLAAVSAMILGMLIAIAPVSYHNWVRGHERVLISTNGGINFYIGNNENYRSTLALRPGRGWDELTLEPVRAGLQQGGSEVSRYFFDKGLGFYKDHFGAASGLLLRKVYLYFNGCEIPRDMDIYGARRDSHLLAALVVPPPIAFPDGLMLPLAAIGLFVQRRRWRTLLLPYGFVVTQALAVSLFFVTSRYRVAGLSMLAVFAVAGAAELMSGWRRSSFRARAGLTSVVALITVALNIPVAEATMGGGSGERDYYRGLAHLGALGGPRDLAAARMALRRAASASPEDPRIWARLGDAARSTEPEVAIDAWLRAAELDPADSTARRSAAELLAQRGEIDRAIGVLQANIDARLHEPAHYAGDHLNLAFARARGGQLALALADFRAAAQEDPPYFDQQAGGMIRALLDQPAIGDATFWNSIGDLLAARGDATLGQTCRERAASRAASPSP